MKNLLHSNPLQKHYNGVQAEIEKEAQHVEHFKEDKVIKLKFSLVPIVELRPQMAELLDYNVRLSDLQSMFSSVFEAISEKRRQLDNMEERKIEKKFSLQFFSEWF